MSNYNLNHTCLSGNLTCDPVLKTFAEGRSKASFGLAVHEVSKKRDGTFATRTNFFDIVAWSPIADSAAKFTAKGDTVIVDGKLVQETWEGKDGVKRSRVIVEAARICFNNPPGRRSGAEGDAQQADSASAPETPWRPRAWTL